MWAVVLAAMLAVSGYAIWDAEFVAQSATVFADDAAVGESLKETSAQSKNLVGWIKIGGTKINQPIMQGADNDYYLRHNYRDEYATAGSVFLDYRNAKDWSDDFAIVYGHRMDGRLMFGDVRSFEDDEFFAGHEWGSLRSDTNNWRVHVLGYAVIDAAEKLYSVKSFSRGRNQDVLRLIGQKKLQWRDGYEGGSLVLLSTCDNNSRLYRDVLLVELREEDGA